LASEKQGLSQRGRHGALIVVLSHWLDMVGRIRLVRVVSGVRALVGGIPVLSHPAKSLVGKRALGRSKPYALAAPARVLLLQGSGFHRGSVSLPAGASPKPVGGETVEGLLRELLREKEEASKKQEEATKALLQEKEEASKKQEEATKALLQEKEEASKKQEEATKALLQEKEEASKKQEEATKALLQEKEEATRALLEAKNDLLVKEETTVAQLSRDIVKLKGEKEAVLVNRVMLEMTVAYFKMQNKSLKGNTRTDVCKRFAREHLLSANNTLTDEAQKTLEQLMKECCGLQGTSGDQVAKTLHTFYETLSHSVHNPDWGRELPDGVYAGGVNRIVDAALGIWIMKAQQLGIIDFTVRLVGSDKQPGCEIRDGLITKVL